jgi:hypothetical protein
MKKMNELDNILDECLQRLIAGETIEACLSRYPDYALALEPLLKTARNTLKATDIRPRPEFRDRARYQYQTAIRELPIKEKRNFFTVLRPALATVVVMAVFLLAGSGVVAAAGGSLPDNPLYQVKLAVEEVRLALMPSDLGKAELNAQFADERVDEIIKMAGKGNIALVEETTDRMNRNLIAVANLTGTGKAMAEGASFGNLQVPAAMTPAPTASPKLTTPSLTPVPSPTTGPPEEGLLGAENQEADRAIDTKSTDDKQAQLRDSLIQQYEENIQALQEELEKAPEALQPALLRAIEVAEQAYATALDNLFY